MASTRHDLILKLFLEDQFPEIYEPVLVNTISGENLIAKESSPFQPKKHDTFLLLDVPDFFELLPKEDVKSPGIRKCRQYEGFAVNLLGYRDTAHYLTENLSARNRKNLRSKKRKLEAAHQITRTIYYGAIAPDEYSYLFSIFFELLKRRFIQKKMVNGNLYRWDYYYKLVYPKILSKEASLFVIKDKGKPITITLNFHKGHMIFSFMETYDIDYAHYNMGDISMVAHLDWCIRNGVALYDLSKGITGHKLKWCNFKYRFEHFVFYRQESKIAWLRASWITARLRLVQRLRDRGIVSLFRFYKTFRHKRGMKAFEALNWTPKYEFPGLE